MDNKFLKSFRELLSGSFFKNVTVLMSGTAIAQGLAFAASPILSRLYDPNAFGIFGLFTAACGLLTVVASGKYELAILLPKKDKDAANLLWLSMGIITFITLLSILIVLLFRESIAGLLGSPELASLLWWAPASIFSMGLYNAFNFWATRRKQFKRLSISRVIQSSGREGTQLVGGFLTNLQGTGLVLGQIVGQAGSAGALIAQTYREDHGIIKNAFEKKRITKLAIKYKDFPKFNAPQVFFNSLSQNAPAILLAYFFNPIVVGLYWFTHRILVAPNRLIGGSVRQVFYQRANELVNSGKSPFGVYWKATKGLVVIAIIPVIVTIFAGPIIFEFIFGSEWSVAGQYAQWLILWWFFYFINPPSIMMIPILNEQKFQLQIGIVSLTLSTLSIVIGGLYKSSILAIALYSIVGAISNAFIIWYIYIKVK